MLVMVFKLYYTLFGSFFVFFPSKPWLTNFLGCLLLNLGYILDAQLTVKAVGICRQCVSTTRN